jgi:hypothetical protein
MPYPATSQSPLLCLPHELRDQIHTNAFEGFGVFPKCWNKVNDSNKSMSGQPPTLSRSPANVSSQLHKFINSLNTQTSQHLLNLYSNFPATKQPKASNSLAFTLGLSKAPQSN